MRRHREADTRRQAFRWSTIAKASKSQTRQIQAPEASNEPKHHDNDQEQTKNASEPSASEAVMSVVPSAAKEKNQDKDDKNRAHDRSSPQFLIAGRAGSINYFFRASRTASVTPPTAFWILPSAWSDFPSLCNLASPIALPMASLPAPLSSLIEPATLFLSMAALLSVLRRHVTGLGAGPVAAVVGIGLA